MPEPVARPLRLHPPFAAPGDTLPLIDDFLEEFEPAGFYDTASTADDLGDDLVSTDLVSIDRYLQVEEEVDADGWAVSSWQSYDWQGLTVLATPVLVAERTEAESAWTATDWGVDAMPADGVTASEDLFGWHPTADEVAEAFDAIAQKIRSGELSIDQVRGTPPEAALAAALAAMLTLRR